MKIFEYRSLLTELDSVGADQDRVRSLFARALALVEKGFIDGAALLGELQALEPSVYDPEAAYRWYYISAATRGDFSTEYKNESEEAGCYLGSPGDFRNEALVADMIEAFGAVKIPELDRQAIAWLGEHRGV